MRHIALSFALALVLVALSSAASHGGSPAFAEIDGPCTGSVKGVDVTDLSSSDAGDAIEVEKDELLDVTLASTSGAPFQSHKIDLEIAGFGFNIEDDPEDSDPVVTETIDVGDYSTYGVGLYKVSGSATLADGTSCSGAVLIEIKGNLLATVAGLGALGVGMLGLGLLGVGALFTLRQFRAIRKQVEAWGAEQMERINGGQDVSPEELAQQLRAIAKPPSMIQLWMIALVPAMLLMGASMPGGMSSSVPLSGLRLPRLPFRPKLSFLGSLGGMLLGETIVTFLNFLAIQPLTGSNMIFGAVAGIVFGVVFDSGVKLLGSRDVNKTISRLERELDEARAKRARQSGESPPPPTAFSPPASTIEPDSVPPPTPDPPADPPDGG